MADRDETVLGFTEEQVMMRDMFRKLAKEEIEPLAAEIDETGQYPDSLIDKFRELGVMGHAFPSEYGGGDGTTIESCIMVEEIAKVCHNSAMMIGRQELAGFPILVAGTKEQKDKWLPKLAGVEIASAFALTEPDAGSDAAGVKTKAEKVSDGYLLNGAKRFISHSDVADIILVFARTAESGFEALSGFIVEKKTPGLTIGRSENKLGQRAVHSCEVFFDNVHVPEEGLLGGKEGTGFKTAMTILDMTRPVVGAAGVGLAEGALGYALAFAKERKQFGKPITAFQVTQFKIAQLAMEIEAARTLVYAAARAVQAKLPEMSKLGAMAKCYGTDVAMKTSLEAIQLMGGSGYMKDYPVERFFRDAKLLQIIEGTNEINRQVIGRAVIGR
jgi:alkylation response protein AidB-like acyl-CoA dehydrogenase